ncbi:MAG: disulfide bond formation protein B [Hyphomonadaceae bacterium]|nr:disulfide bond formation protein B [Hyphomonadaceae bacterium]
MDLISRLRSIWPVAALLGSGALLAGAHAFQRLGGLAPCPLCLQQREWHWAVVGVALIALALRFTPLNRPRLAASVLGVVLLGAAGMAFYHVGVEQGWFVATCEANFDLGDIQAFDPNATLVAPTCTTPAWTMFGISMAGYNAIISFLLALASFLVAFMPEQRNG